jgi:hypothetical protein
LAAKADKFQGSYREGADPAIIIYKGDYYLFVSHSGGYWWSPDLKTWNFVTPTGLDIIDTYAPGVVVVGDTVFFTACFSDGYFTTDPKGGVWHERGGYSNGGDPSYLLDDDGKLYVIDGMAGAGGCQVDRSTLQKIGNDINTGAYGDCGAHGWECLGDDNTNTGCCGAFEGPWMNKYNGVYYLQYAAPGTEFISYGDGVYTATNINGPYAYQDYSPFSHKPGPDGFICSAGHSCTFQDKFGNWWHVATMLVGVKNSFERRIGLFPAGFDAAGQLYTRTDLGDFPLLFPTGVRNHLQSNAIRPGWMLLSRNRPATASTGANPGNAADEDVRTGWTSGRNTAGDWLAIDLQATCRINAVQVNFDDGNFSGDRPTGGHRYVLEASDNGSTWSTLVDKSANTQDVPHDYVELAPPAQARYVRVRNVSMPSNSEFSLRDLRAFGLRPGNPPPAVSSPAVQRSGLGKQATISWQASSGAEGYIIRYGIAANKLYNHYQVFGKTTLTINSLNTDVPYFFAVDAFNGGGYSSAGVTGAASTLTNGNSRKTAPRMIVGPPDLASQGPLFDVRGRRIAGAGVRRSSAGHSRSCGVYILE